jgi:hypothetical protein
MAGTAALIDYGKCVATVYELALNPTEEQLPLSRVLAEIELADAELCGDLDDTNQLWRLRSHPISFGPGEDSRRFSAPNFGRAVIAEVEPPPGSFERRRVYITDLTDFDRYQSSGSTWTGLYLGQMFPVEEIAFFRKDNEVWARVAPVPRTSVTLTIHYEPGPAVDMLEEERPDSVVAASLVAFPLLANLAAQAALSGLDHRPEPVIRRKLDQLQRREAALRMRWSEYILADHQADNSGVIEGFRVGGVRRSVPRYQG